MPTIKMYLDYVATNLGRVSANLALVERGRCSEVHVVDM